VKEHFWVHDPSNFTTGIQNDQHCSAVVAVSPTWVQNRMP